MTNEFEKALVAVSAALAEIDPAAARAEIAEIDTRIVAVNAALRAGEDRIEELRDEIQTRRALGPDRHAAASAMLAGESVLERVPGPELLTEESDTIKAGLIGLRERRQDLISDRERAALALDGELSLAFAPAVEALWVEAQSAIKRVLDVRMSAAAIYSLIRAGEAGHLAEALYQTAMIALDAQFRPGRVDEGLIEVLEAARAIASIPSLPKAPERPARAVRQPWREGEIRSTALN